MERIYLLEDDDSIRKLVIYALGSQGYEAQGFDRPSDFWSAMEGPQPALILLDIMLPEEDGLSILQKLRASAATKRRQELHAAGHFRFGEAQGRKNPVSRRRHHGKEPY